MTPVARTNPHPVTFSARLAAHTTTYPDLRLQYERALILGDEEQMWEVASVAIARVAQLERALDSERTDRSTHRHRQARQHRKVRALLFPRRDVIAVPAEERES